MAEKKEMTLAELQKLMEEQQKLIAELTAAKETAEAAAEAVKEESTVPAAVLENEAKMREMVKIKLFKDNGKYKDDVFVAVNGQSYQIQRGVEVKVPRFVKEVLDSSLEQDQYAASYSEMLSGKFEEARTHLE